MRQEFMIGKKSSVALALFFLAFSAFAEDVTVQVNGKTIILHDNKTWEVVETSANKSENLLELKKAVSQSQFLGSDTGKFSVSYDPLIWDKVKPFNESAEFSFQNKAKSGFGMVIFEGLGTSLEALKNALVSNAKNIDPNATIQDVQPCSVNGIEGELVTYVAVGQGIPFTLLAFIATGEFGSIQFTFYTSTTSFPKLKSEFIKAISGLKI